MVGNALRDGLRKAIAVNSERVLAGSAFMLVGCLVLGAAGHTFDIAELTRTPVTQAAVTLVLQSIDRIKQIVADQATAVATPSPKVVSA